MKTLAESRDELANEHYAVREKMFDVSDFSREVIAIESYKLGFDAGANAVLERAQKLYDRLDQLYKDKYTNQHDIAALEEWQEFVAGVKK